MSLMSHVPDGTVQEILNWVDDDPAKARAALEVERGDEAPRTTLLDKLEAIASEESDMTTYKDAPEADTHEAEVPIDVALDTDDASTLVGPVQARDSEVAVPDADDLDVAGAAQTEFLQVAAGVNGVVVALNGTAYALTPQMAVALKQAVDRAVVGLSL
jgi:hypothetical protein